MASFSVAISAVLPESVEGHLRAGGMPLDLWRLAGTGEDYLVEALRDVDAVIVGSREAITARVIDGMFRCRVISRYGVGIDNVDVAAATRRAIPVAYLLDANVEDVSDHAVALMLACARHVVALNAIIKSGRWAREGTPALAPARASLRRLRGRTLGLVGFGRIARATWSKVRGLGLESVVYDPLVPEEMVRSHGAEPVGWEDLLARSDFISIHVPLTPETRGMFGREAFARMKPTAFLINTARGAIVEEAALAEAITTGRLAGAALDVTAVEPLPADSPLMGLEQVLLTGHSAFCSEEGYADLDRGAAEAVLAVFRGESPRVVANPSVIGSRA